MSKIREIDSLNYSADLHDFIRSVISEYRERSEYDIKNQFLE